MPVYTVCQLFEVKNHHRNECSGFEESWKIVRAHSELEAKAMVIENGISESESFFNNRNDLVEWNFLGIRQLKEIQVDDNIVELITISRDHPTFVEITKDDLTSLALQN